MQTLMTLLQFYSVYFWLGLSIKTTAVKGEGRRRYVHWEHFSDKWFRCERLNFLLQKTQDFLKIMLCPYGQVGRGWGSAYIL